MHWRAQRNVIFWQSNIIPVSKSRSRTSFCSRNFNYVFNRLYSGKNFGKEIDITKRPEHAFYSKDKQALTGKLLK